ncbi:uncharacterized protein Dana_GF22003 [Drosophila ananassae]|uniref:Uncharacterized protein n=1 Tax=Drosophila ananassae TaxID=7217 RepID=B3MYM3_DROAN|nr:uncharacterized protein LOC6504673 [Drosophila ananassae]EDV32717.1 uncharacterized protein Dana_GF22003 [Drosophila ananassae]
MWMQIGSRAFSSGTNKRRRRREDGQGEERSLTQVPASSPTGSSSNNVFLANPSMNELMRTIHHTAASKDDLQGVVVLGTRILDMDLSDFDEDPDDEDMDEMKDCLEIIRLQLGHERLTRGQGHSKSHHLRGTKDSKDNEIDLHRTLSVDGFSHAHRSLQDTSDCLLWEVHSEGALIPLPGIDSTLAEQMVLLKPVCEQVLRQTELLSGHRMCLDQRDSDSSSTWSLLANGGKYIVSRTISASQSGAPSTSPSSRELEKESEKQKSEGLWYWINLAHILMVIACLRGVF